MTPGQRYYRNIAVYDVFKREFPLYDVSPSEEPRPLRRRRRDPASISTQRCKSKTAKGKPCPRYSIGWGYCWTHRTDAARK